MIDDDLPVEFRYLRQRSILKPQRCCPSLPPRNRIYREEYLIKNNEMMCLYPAHMISKPAQGS